MSVDDPNEFNNLWHLPAKQQTKMELLKRSFDASMFALDKGPKRVGPM